MIPSRDCLMAPIHSDSTSNSKTFCDELQAVHLKIALFFPYNCSSLIFSISDKTLYKVDRCFARYRYYILSRQAKSWKNVQGRQAILTKCHPDNMSSWKVTICCQKLPFVAKSYHLLPTGTICLPGQNVALPNRDDMSPGTKCRPFEQQNNGDIGRHIVPATYCPGTIYVLGQNVAGQNVSWPVILCTETR